MVVVVLRNIYKRCGLGPLEGLLLLHINMRNIYKHCVLGPSQTAYWQQLEDDTGFVMSSLSTPVNINVNAIGFVFVDTIQ